MRSPYGDDGRVRGSLAYPHRDNGYGGDPVGESVCNRVALAQAAREWADRLAAIPPDALKGPRTLKQKRADTARRQDAARVREANR